MIALFWTLVLWAIALLLIVLALGFALAFGSIVALRRYRRRPIDINMEMARLIDSRRHDHEHAARHNREWLLHAQCRKAR